jgi:hypothetical protein
MNTAPTPSLTLTLADGMYARTESIRLLRGWVEAHVRFLESQVDAQDSPEDVAMRERQIARIQHEFSAAMSVIASMNGGCVVRANLEIVEP